MGDEDEGMLVMAKVLPENREVYSTLVQFAEEKGMSRDEINTKLFNAGLVAWVEQINRQMDAGLDSTDGGEEEDEGTD